MASALKIRKLNNNALLFNSIFALIVSAIFAINILYLFETNNKTHATNELNAAYHTLHDNDAIYITLLEIERNHQYYILTGDNSYLTKMTNLIKKINYQIGHFDHNFLHTRTENYSTTPIYNLIQSRIDSLNLLIKTKESGDNLNAEDYKLLESTNNVAERVNLLLSTNNHSILSKIKYIKKATNKYNNLTTYVILAISFIIILLQITYQILINQLFRKNKKLIDAKMTANLQLDCIIEGTTDLICSLDINKQYIIFNSAYRTFVKKSFNQDIHLGSKNTDIMIATWEKTLEGKKFEEEITINNRILYVRAIPITNNSNDVIGATLVMEDITQHVAKDKKISELYKKSEHEVQELSEQNHKMQLLIELNDTMQACANIEEVVKAICSYSARILEFSKRGCIFIMNTSTELLEYKCDWGSISDQDQHFTSEQCWALRRGYLYFNEYEEKDLFCEHVKNTENINFSTVCIPLAARNNILGLLHIRFSKSIHHLPESTRILITAIAESAALSISNIMLREKLNEQSTHDPLTGLHNRRYLDEYLVKQLNQAKRSNVALSVILFDIDHFKTFNDNYGHEIGDQMLKELGERFASVVRSGDLACRYGGEEFIWVLYDCDTQQAKLRFEMLQNATTKIVIKVGLQKIPAVTLSAGIASFPTHATTPSELIECSDQALYDAKNAGRDTIAIYSETKNNEKTDS